MIKKEKHEKTTVTVRLRDEEDQVLRLLCVGLLKRFAITLKPVWTDKSEIRHYMERRKYLGNLQCYFEGCRLEGKIRSDIVIDLKYSLVIEATEDPTFFGFYSPPT